MIQPAVENKYSFNMQVSVEAMAALRSRPRATTFDERIQLIRYPIGHRPSAQLFRKWPTKIANKVGKCPNFTKPVLCSAMPLLAQTTGAAARSLRGWLADPSGRVMAAYSIRICAGHGFRRVLRRLAGARAVSARAGFDLALVFNF